MIKINNTEMCTGCTACKSICPSNAIRMKPDEEGFLYPIVDEEKCTMCGLCIKICPKINENNIDNGFKELGYACYTKLDLIREKSSSGGIFYELSKAIIEREGVVFGAGYDKEFNVVNKKVEEISQVYTLMGSKYVQSNLNDCFMDVKKFLMNGKYVLFVGTTCQIEGLLAIIPDKFLRNLYTVDLICLGIPSPMVWNQYKKSLEKRGNIQDINFKNKKYGWNKFHLSVIYSDRTIYLRGIFNSYMQLFFRKYSVRPSCFKCTIKTKKRKADITLADCWGIKDFAPELNDNRGCSSIIIHSVKGKELFAMIEDKLVLKQVCIDDIIEGNPNYTKSASKTKMRKLFWRIYKVNPNIAIQLFGLSVNLQIKEKLKQVMRRKK